jgi:hypothetical protein
MQSSRLTTVGRVLALVRDVLLIAVLTAGLVLGFSAVSSLRSTAPQPRPAVTFDPLTDCNPTWESC